MNKKALRIIGFLLILIGIIFLIIGFSGIFAFASSLSFGAFGGASRGILQLFIGGGCILVGAFMVYASYIGKIFSYATKETAPGIERVSRAVGKGFSKGYNKKKK
ncbi:MAG: hypothetical protein KKH88_03530 [Nanoarchaeota archaeon]|nr:hypothetical protein [Nanoarchaeota archaeon]